MCNQKCNPMCNPMFYSLTVLILETWSLIPKRTIREDFFSRGQGHKFMGGRVHLSWGRWAIIPLPSQAHQGKFFSRGWGSNFGGRAVHFSWGRCTLGPFPMPIRGENFFLYFYTGKGVVMSYYVIQVLNYLLGSTKLLGNIDISTCMPVLCWWLMLVAAPPRSKVYVTQSVTPKCNPKV